MRELCGDGKARLLDGRTQWIKDGISSFVLMAAVVVVRIKVVIVQEL